MSTATISRTTSAPAGEDRGAARVGLMLPPLVEVPTEDHDKIEAEVAVRLVSARSRLDSAAGPVPPRSDPAPDQLPDPRAVAGPLVLAAQEALTGTRPLAQLTRWVTPELYTRLAEALPLTRTTTTRRRARVLSVRAENTSPGVAEVTVVLHDGSRVRAAAARLETHRGRWRATVLDIG